MISTPEQYEATKEWIVKFEKKLAYLASKDGKEVRWYPLFRPNTIGL
jgi:hypothetical protein